MCVSFKSNPVVKSHCHKHVILHPNEDIKKIIKIQDNKLDTIPKEEIHNIDHLIQPNIHYIVVYLQFLFVCILLLIGLFKLCNNKS